MEKKTDTVHITRNFQSITKQSDWSNQISPRLRHSWSTIPCDCNKHTDSVVRCFSTPRFLRGPIRQHATFSKCTFPNFHLTDKSRRALEARLTRPSVPRIFLRWQMHLLLVRPYRIDSMTEFVHSHEQRAESKPVVIVSRGAMVCALVCRRRLWCDYHSRDISLKCELT